MSIVYDSNILLDIVDGRLQVHLNVVRKPSIKYVTLLYPLCRFCGISQKFDSYGPVLVLTNS